MFFYVSCAFCHSSHASCAFCTRCDMPAGPPPSKTRRVWRSHAKGEVKDEPSSSEDERGGQTPAGDERGGQTPAGSGDPTPATWVEADVPGDSDEEGYREWAREIDRELLAKASEDTTVFSRELAEGAHRRGDAARAQRPADWRPALRRDDAPGQSSSSRNWAGGDSWRYGDVPESSATVAGCGGQTPSSSSRAAPAAAATASEPAAFASHGEERHKLFSGRYSIHGGTTDRGAQGIAECASP